MEKKTEWFVNKSKEVHGESYDYSKTTYIKSKEKTTIYCKIHGAFTITPNSHLAGQGCKSCGVEKRASKQRGDNELFLEKAKETHGDKYDYSKVEYYNSTTKVEIICKKHGSFLQTPKIHYKANCPECGRDSQIEKASKPTQKFIDEMVEKYGDKYDLSLVKYVNSKTPVKLICSVRGIIEAKPNELLSKQIYVSQGRKKTKSTDKEMFLKEVYKIYGDKNDYTNTKVGDSRGKIDVECKQHGKFTISMQGHFSGQGCPKCSAINYSKVRRLSTEKFIERAKKVHGDSCDYTKTVYKTCNDKVVIKCKEHDIYFKVFPSNHIIGSKCKKCQSEKIRKALTGKEGTCGYTRTGYVKQANGRQAKVYLIKCFSEEEEFYKIGKTFLDINIRFKKANLPYSFESVNFIFGEAGYIYDLEVELHKIYREYKYKPKNRFGGYTECYKINLPIEEIKNYE